MSDCLARILSRTRSSSRGDLGEEADSSHPLDKPTTRHAGLAARRLSGLLTWKLWVVLWAVGVSTPLEAAPGDLDPSFDVDGRLLIDGFGAADEVNAVVVQPDGKLVVAGTVRIADTASSFEFALVRLNPDGSPDTSFDFDGLMLTNFGDFTIDEVFALVIQPDGKLVAAGGSAGSDGTDRLDFVLARYNPDGSLDTSFDGDGLVLTDFSGSGSADVASALVVHPNGKLVAVGFVGFSDASDFKFDFALARYHPNGSLDTSFGVNGRVLTDFSGAGSPDLARALALQPDGKLVAAGLSGSGPDFALARYEGEPILCNGLVVTQLGTSTNDLLIGTAGDDVIHGHGGDDDIKGLEGNDTICGGAGRDTLRGGGGDDRLFGGKGADTLKGGTGTDLCNGGKGAGDTAASNCETVINVP